jgi:hypothetical protein
MHVSVPEASEDYALIASKLAHSDWNMNATAKSSYLSALDEDGRMKLDC